MRVHQATGDDPGERIQQAHLAEPRLEQRAERAEVPLKVTDPAVELPPRPKAYLLLATLAWTS